MRAPIAAIVVPAYNCAKTIRGALDSIANAIAFHNSLADGTFEIIVVDDASTDATPTVAADWAAARGDTTIVRLAQNADSPQARNAGAARATAPLLFFLDADDEFLAPHLYCCIETMSGLPDAGYARPNLAFDVDIHSSWQAALSSVQPSNLCVRKVCHDFIGGFFAHDYLRTFRVEDLVYTRMLTRYFAGVRLDIATALYRRYPGNAFDRQMAKFQRPVGEGPDSLTAEEAHLEPLIESMVVSRLDALDRAARQPGPAGPPRRYSDTKAPIWYARDIATWLDGKLKMRGKSAR